MQELYGLAAGRVRQAIDLTRPWEIRHKGGEAPGNVVHLKPSNRRRVLGTGDVTRSREPQQARRSRHRRVLDEALWASAALIDEFIQQEPYDGAPATERTDVRVLYDGGNSYLGVRAFDSDRNGVIAAQMRRHDLAWCPQGRQS